MFRKINNFFSKHVAMILCGVTILAVPLISQECQMIWFQEKEPEGMEEFLKEKNR